MKSVLYNEVNWSHRASFSVSVLFHGLSWTSNKLFAEQHRTLATLWVAESKMIPMIFFFFYTLPPLFWFLLCYPHLKLMTFLFILLRRFSHSEENICKLHSMPTQPPAPLSLCPDFPPLPVTELSTVQLSSPPWGLFHYFLPVQGRSTSISPLPLWHLHFFAVCYIIPISLLLFLLKDKPLPTSLLLQLPPLPLLPLRVKIIETSTLIVSNSSPFILS